MTRVRLFIILIVSFVPGVFGYMYPSAVEEVASVVVSLIGILAAASLAVFAAISSRKFHVDIKDEEMRKRIEGSIRLEKVQLLQQQTVIFSVLCVSVLLCVVLVATNTVLASNSLVIKIIAAGAAYFTTAGLLLGFLLPLILSQLIFTAR